MQRRCDRASVSLELEDRTLSATVRPTRSDPSQVELPITFGLGSADKIKRLVVHWPNCPEQVFENPAVDQTLEIEQHKGSNVALGKRF